MKNIWRWYDTLDEPLRFLLFLLFMTVWVYFVITFQANIWYFLIILILTIVMINRGVYILINDYGE